MALNAIDSFWRDQFLFHLSAPVLLDIFQHPTVCSLSSELKSTLLD
jgi:hypothetical protein